MSSATSARDDNLSAFFLRSLPQASTTRCPRPSRPPRRSPAASGGRPTRSWTRPPWLTTFTSTWWTGARRAWWQWVWGRASTFGPQPPAGKPGTDATPLDVDCFLCTLRVLKEGGGGASVRRPPVVPESRNPSRRAGSAGATAVGANVLLLTHVDVGWVGWRRASARTFICGPQRPAGSLWRGI